MRRPTTVTPDVPYSGDVPAFDSDLQRWGRLAVAYTIAAALLLLYDAPAGAVTLLLVPPAAVTGLLALAAGRRSADPRASRAWFVIAAAMLVQAAIDTTWGLFELRLGFVPPGASALRSALCWPLLLLGTVLFPRGRRTVADAARFSLDAGIAIGSVLMVTWHFVLRPMLAGLDTGTAQDPLTLVATTLDVVALVTAVSLILQEPGPTLRRSSWWLAMALLMCFIAANASSALALQLGYGVHEIAAVGRLAGALMLLLCAQCGHRDAHVPLEASRLRARFSVLPYVALLMGYGLLFGIAARQHADLVQLVGVASVVLVLLVVRQALAVRENQKLRLRKVAKESESRFQSLIRHASDVFLIVEPDAHLRFVSPASRRIFGTAPDVLLGTSLYELVAADDRPVLDALLEQTLRTLPTQASPSATLRMRGREGTWIRTEVLATNLVKDPNVQGMVVTVRDITERAILEEHLRHQALHDPLTGLANRALFRDRVSHALARAHRSRERIAVVFLDLDDFKEINDSLGHAAGDAVIVQMGSRLRLTLRESDTAGRLGGDEFAILLENVRDEQELMEIARRLSETLARPMLVEGREVDLRASIGIAEAQPGESAEDLLRNADVAMYHAKSSGKRCIVLFETGMHAAVLSRLELQGDLKRAVERDELVLAYQPIVELATQRIVGAEALLRWRHPQRGLVQPTDFIPLAEETGLIVPIGRWVLRRACAEAAAWPVAPGRSPITITVNLSARQVTEEGLLADVAHALASSGLPGHRLVLELTESTLVTREAVMRERLQELKALGVRLAVDDFGTGLSSLASLSQYPLDVLKVDKQFVRGLDAGDAGRALARAVVSLGKALRLQVVAEGIETRDQEWDLRALGCEFGQGFLYAAPVAAEAIETMIALGEVDVPRPLAPPRSPRVTPTLVAATVPAPAPTVAERMVVHGDVASALAWAEAAAFGAAPPASAPPLPASHQSTPTPSAPSSGDEPPRPPLRLVS
jgi:diguanylate cyclase (GGDEF)-like protein/PAS domain S-box-containing protein